MDKDSIVLQGNNLEKLIVDAAEKLGSVKDNLDIEILEENKKFFGTNYKIKVGLKEEHLNLEKINRLEKTLDNIETSLNSSSTANDYNENIAENKEVIIEDKGLEEKASNDIDEKEAEIIDCSYEISVSPDKMEAYIIVFPPQGGKEVELNDIYEQLELNNIKYGLINDTINSIVNNKVYSQKKMIAIGTPPINGKDAVLDYHFDISVEKKVSISEDGKVDFRELSLIKNINEDQLLVTMIPPTEGVVGYNVHNEEVKAKDGKKLNLPKGKNVKATEDGLGLVSTSKGEVKLIDNKVHVLPIYEVPANVDNSTGNIRFYGKVIVRGNVITGFSIDADEDIEVYGVVEGAYIKAGGNIILHRGMQGMNKGELQCGGDLIAKFIENSKVYAKGNIEAEAIMHSIVYCGKRMEVKGRKGLLVGGDIKACEEIKAKVIGSPMATSTNLEVGTNPEIRTKYDSLKNEQEITKENYQRLSQAVDLLTKYSKKAELPDDKRVLLNKSIVMKLQTKERIKNLRTEIKDLESYIEDISNGKIKVEQLVYPGTKITIGSNSLYIKDQVQYATFYRYGGEVKIGSYEK
ncbi:MAG: FapA family protein [Firmicutes bacterium]|nr:FapA family protein [Bacillota bacterium]